LTEARNRNIPGPPARGAAAVLCDISQREITRERILDHWPAANPRNPRSSPSVKRSSLMRSANFFCLIASVSLVALSGCDAEPQDSAETKPALTITTAEIRSEVWPHALEVHGQIAPWHEAVISARVAGLPLVEVRVDVGDRVKRGDLLARFDDRTVRADLAQAQASVAQAAANARQALANRDRAAKLRPDGLVSEQDLQLQGTQLEAAEAQRALAAAQVTAQEVRLQDCEVRAVDDGVISVRSAALGQVAQPGGELFRLIRRERLDWRAELTAAQMSQVKPGQSAHLTLADGSKATGEVRQISPVLDNSSRLGIAYVDIQAGSGALSAMYASGRIIVSENAALALPAEAVVLRDGRSSVFVVNAEDRVSQVPVELGRRSGDFVEIRSALKVGDRVAVRGAGFLNDGDRVKRVEPKTEVAT
jgi:HlyD family secretion protein